MRKYHFLQKIGVLHRFSINSQYTTIVCKYKCIKCTCTSFSNGKKRVLDNCFPVSRRVQINVIFPDNVSILFYTAMQCKKMLNVYIKRQNHWTCLVQFLIGYLERGTRLASVYNASLIRHGVSGDILCLVVIRVS